MEFVSLSTIIEDLLLIIRGSKIAASEKISKRQIEAWIHQYRALLLRQNLSGGDTINPDYIQTIPSIQLVPIDAAGNITTVETGSVFYRTSSKLPKTVNLKYKSGVTYVGTLNKRRIQLIPGHRAEFQLYRRYTPAETAAYLEDGYLYLINPHGIRYVTIRGVFEIPPEAALYSNTTMNAQSYTLDSPYPIPVNMIPALKQMILEQELGIEAVSPTDSKNDSKHEVK